MLSLNFILEILGVASAMGYVVLASKQHVLCWPVSLVSCVVYTYLCYSSGLYMESVLQVFYILVSMYGWMKWNESESSLRLTRGSVASNLFAIISLSIVGSVLGYLISTYTQAKLPYADSLTFVFSVYATFITAQKKIENWLYWIVIDAASVFIYINRELHLTALLFFVYACMAIYGYIQWRNAQTLEN